MIIFESYSFFRRCEVVAGKNVRQQTCFLFVFVTFLRFFVRVQSPTCTTYGKFLLESIMAMLTPKLGIRTIIVCVIVPSSEPILILSL